MINNEVQVNKKKLHVQVSSVRYADCKPGDIVVVGKYEGYILEMNSEGKETPTHIFEIEGEDRKVRLKSNYQLDHTLTKKHIGEIIEIIFIEKKSFKSSSGKSCYVNVFEINLVDTIL